MDPAALSGQLASLDSSYNPTQVYNDVTTKLGIPDARTQVQSLQKNLVDTQNAINAVDPSVTGRTSNSLVTEAQRGRLVNMEKQPLQQTYSTQNQSLGTDTTNLNNLQSEADRQVGAAQTEYTNKRSALAGQLQEALTQQEQQRQAEAAQAAAAEQQREFNITSAQNATKIAQSGQSKSGASANAPAYQQRSGGGFNFQDSSGKAISARLYAQQTGTDFNALLKQMAASGDSGAKDVLAKGAKSAAYKALTWN
jgi:hypothetical protein